MITNFKTKLTKKAISLLLLVAMALTLSANIGFSAFATEQQEIDFCVDKMKNLPTDEKFLEEMLKLPEEKDLKQLRHVDVVHKDGTTEPVDLNEKECYQEIQALVKSLTKEFDIQQSGDKILNLAGDKDNLLNSANQEAQKAGKLSANIQKADAIYRWVAEKIHYDHESYDAIVKPESTSAKSKPQDAGEGYRSSDRPPLSSAYRSRGFLHQKHNSLGHHKDCRPPSQWQEHRIPRFSGFQAYPHCQAACPFSSFHA